MPARRSFEFMAMCPRPGSAICRVAAGISGGGLAPNLKPGLWHAEWLYAPPSPPLHCDGRSLAANVVAIFRPGASDPLISISRRSDVEPFHAMDILAEANALQAQGHPVISMAVGQPSDPAPRRCARPPRQALIGGQDRLHGRAGHRRIAPRHLAALLPSLRARRAGLANRRHDRLFGGLQPGLPGDASTPATAVAISSPGYPAYRNIMAALGLEVVEIELPVMLTLHAGHLRRAHAQGSAEGRAVCASPANPTGAVAPDAELQGR